MKKKWILKIMSLALIVTMAMPSMNLYAEENAGQETTEQVEKQELSSTEDSSEMIPEEPETEKTEQEESETEEPETEEPVPYAMDEVASVETQTEETELPLHKIGIYKDMYKEDGDKPVIKDVSMNIESGSYVESGTIVFTVTAECETGLKQDGAYLILSHRQLNDTEAGKGGNKKINLTYKGNGIYEGTCEAEELEACEHYVSAISIYDAAGQIAAYCSDDIDFDNYSFYVRRDGKTRDEVYSNVNVCFYSGERNNYNSSVIKTIVKDIPVRTTYGEVVGDEAPVLPADLELGEFCGWVYYKGEHRIECKEDTALHLEFYGTSREIRFYPLYEKSKIRWTASYLKEDGWFDDRSDENGFVGKEAIVNSKASMEEIEALLPKVENTVGQSHFEGWKLVQGNADGLISYVLDFEAVYDQYAVNISRTYLDKTGAVKRITEQKYYPKGTDYKDIVKEYKQIPEDASEEMSITGWYLYDPKFEIRTKGEVGPITGDYLCQYYTKVSYIDLVAEYEEKELEAVSYEYITPEGEKGEKLEFILCGKHASRLEVKTEAMNYIPQELLPGLEYTGDWLLLDDNPFDNDFVYGSMHPDLTYSDEKQDEHYNYKMEPIYKNTIVECIAHDKNYNIKRSYYAVKQGDIIKCPKGYRMAMDVSPSIWWDSSGPLTAMDEYVVGSDKYEKRVIWQFLYWDKKAENSLTETIENAQEGEVVEGETENGFLGKDILESLKEKKASLLLTIDKGTTGVKWKIDGNNIQEDNLTDIDFNVTRTDKDSGYIFASDIDAIAGNRMTEQLIFGADGTMEFMPQLIMETEADNSAEKGVLLQKDGDTLTLAGNALIVDGVLTLDITRKADSAVVYGTNGDTDGDNKVKIKDAMQILQHTSSRKAMNEVQKGFADTDSNNKINLQDVMREMHYISGRSHAVYEKESSL